MYLPDEGRLAQSELKPGDIMNANAHSRGSYASAVTLLLIAFTTPVSAQPAKAPPGQAGAVITVIVPPDAELFFDGAPTTQEGSERRFVSPPVPVEGKYDYDIRARWTEDGKKVEQTRRVSVSGGASVRVDFLSPLPERKKTVERGAAYPAPRSAEQSEEERQKDKAAIQRNGELFVEAFHKGDAKALAALWTADGDYTDLTGHLWKGRDAIEKLFEGYFADNKGLKLRIDSQSLRFVTPDVALEDGTTEVIPANGGPPSRARYNSVHVKTDGQWQVSSVRDAPFVPPSNRDHLRGLESAIGDWAGEADKGEVERLSVAWAENDNFIIATFSKTFGDMTVAKAIQWIGWDPLAKRVRSWIFDSAGGFGGGSWTQDGKQWVIKTDSVLQDGKKATATYLVTQVDVDTISLQARDRSVDGKAIPDSPEVRLKRVK